MYEGIQDLVYLIIQSSLKKNVKAFFLSIETEWYLHSMIFLLIFSTILCWYYILTNSCLLLVYKHFEGNADYGLLIFASPQSLLGTQ